MDTIDIFDSKWFDMVTEDEWDTNNTYVGAHDVYDFSEMREVIESQDPHAFIENPDVLTWSKRLAAATGIFNNLINDEQLSSKYKCDILDLIILNIESCIDGYISVQEYYWNAWCSDACCVTTDECDRVYIAVMYAGMVSEKIRDYLRQCQAQLRTM